MPRTAQAVESKRRSPRQARAAATVDAIFEAAAQILEADGLDALTTNRVAERAGVSIGSLYQYFGDKSDLLRALARREMERVLSEVMRIAGAEHLEPGVDRTRVSVRAMIRAFGGRQRARKAVIQAAFAHGFAMEFLRPAQVVADGIATRFYSDGRLPIARLVPIQAFVLTRSVMGVIRAAVLEDSPQLKSQAMEDEVVRLIESYLRGIAEVT